MVVGSNPAYDTEDALRDCTHMTLAIEKYVKPKS